MAHKPKAEVAEDVRVMLAERIACPGESRSECKLGYELGLPVQTVKALLREEEFQAQVEAARDAWVTKERDLLSKLEHLDLYTRIQNKSIEIESKRKLLTMLSQIQLDHARKAVDWRNEELGAVLSILKALSQESPQVVIGNSINNEAAGSRLTDDELEAEIQRAVQGAKGAVVRSPD